MKGFARAFPCLQFPYLYRTLYRTKKKSNSVKPQRTIFTTIALFSSFLYLGVAPVAHAAAFTFADLTNANLGLDPIDGLIVNANGDPCTPLINDGTVNPLHSAYCSTSSYSVVVGTGGEDVFISAGPNPNGFEVLVEPPGVGEADFSQAASLNPSTGSPGIYVNLSLADQGLGPYVEFTSSSYDPSMATGGAGFAGVIDSTAQTVTPFSYLYGMTNIVGTNGSDIFVTDQLADTFIYTGAAGASNFDSLYGNGIEACAADFGDFEGAASTTLTYATVYGNNNPNYHLGYYGADGNGTVNFGTYVDLLANGATATDGFGNPQTVQVWSLSDTGLRQDAMAHLSNFGDVLEPVGISYINGDGNDNGFNFWGTDGIPKTAINSAGVGGAPQSDTLTADAQYGFKIFNGGISTPLLDANNVPLTMNSSAPGAYTPANIDAALAAASLMGMGNEVEFADFGSYTAALHLALQGTPVGVLPNSATGIYLDMAVSEAVTVPDPINGGTMDVNGSLVKLIEGNAISKDAMAMLQWSTHNDTVGDLVTGTSVAAVTSTADGSDVVYGDDQDNTYTYCGDGTMPPAYFDGRGQAGPHVAADGTVYLGGETGDQMSFGEFSPLNVVGVNADLTSTYGSFTDAIGGTHSGVYEAFTIGDPGGLATPNDKVLVAAFTDIEHIMGSGNNDYLQGVFASDHPVSDSNGNFLENKATDFDGLDGNDTFAFTQLTNNTSHWHYNPYDANQVATPTDFIHWHADFGTAEIVDFDATTGQHDTLLLNHLDWMADSGFITIFNNASLSASDKAAAEALYVLDNYVTLDANGDIVIHASTGFHTLDDANTITLQNVDLLQDLIPNAAADVSFI